MSDSFPRELSERERDLLLWVLPEDRPGYNEARSLVQTWKVVAGGRRGEGNYLLASPGARIDIESPLPHVLAYGVVEYESGKTSVTIRERLDDQLEFEIAGVSTAGTERRRWTYSTWLPTTSCPDCGTMPREVQLTTERGVIVTLAICSRDRRLWVFEERTKMNRPVPVTSFYSELMRVKGIRDPHVALRPDLLFEQLATYPDAILVTAFAAYNSVRAKVPTDDPFRVPEQPTSFISRLFSYFQH